ncbi:type II toxin-antitoxin system VapC family toxin [Microbacterium sp.]|uniref:type II toxin-antitoxin system VapC family toxin n=1 Tax=Microbacterium sp. TaxID=51671 RepID=UPI003A9232C3
MIVTDASAVIDLVADIGRKSLLRDRLSGDRLLAPNFLPVEVASGLRGMNLGGKLADRDLRDAVGFLRLLRVDLHPSIPLIPRAMTLRHDFSAYDASYVALAEAYGCPLLTYDKRLAKAAKKHCAIEVVSP